MNDILLYVGSGVIIAWGIAHIIPTKSVVGGFGSASMDNKRIITMEWIAEGLALCFVGLLVTAIGDSGNNVSDIVYQSSAAMLFVMAVLTLLTGSRTSIIPIRICPFVKTSVAILFLLGSLL